MFVRTLILICCSLACYSVTVHAMVVMDRVAIIVGRRAVKASDLDRDLRVSEFLNGQPLNVTADARRKAADRLIEQELIRQELANGNYSRPAGADVDAFMSRLKQSRFGASDAQYRAALTKYGLTEEQLRQALLWQLSVLRFIDQRFRPGVLVTDEDVKAYYDQHRAELQKANQGATFEALDPKIRDIISGERINQIYSEWIDQQRKSTRIELREGAFTEGAGR